MKVRHKEGAPLTRTLRSLDIDHQQARRKHNVVTQSTT